MLSVYRGFYDVVSWKRNRQNCNDNRVCIITFTTNILLNMRAIHYDRPDNSLTVLTSVTS